jgi:uncharacterized protein with HEPN domain
MRRDKIYIGQIIVAIEKIEDYTKEGQEAFKNAEIIQDAVIRNIEVVGEVAKKISNVFKEQNSNIPWRKMAGIRDVLIHDYDSIDMNIVWNVVANELPKIKLFLKI